MSAIIRFLKNNGERPPLKKSFEQIQPVLQLAYAYVAQYVKGKSVLDYGCGGGYGTEYLSRFTSKTVTGFDIDHYTINSAGDYFQHIKNLNFTATYPVNKFDIVVSFQVIEHLDPNSLKAYLSNIKSSLLPHSRLYIATVNKNISSYNLKIPTMSHHVYEYKPLELKNLLRSHFSKVTMFGQIDSLTKSKVLNNTFSYNNLSNIPLKYRLLRPFTQISLIRLIAAYTPQSIKDFVFHQTHHPNVTYSFVKNTRLINNSYILFYDCLL